MSLTVAFTTLATTEPTLSRNHALSAQARMVAESGIERATWGTPGQSRTRGGPRLANFVEPDPPSQRGGARRGLDDLERVDAVGRGHRNRGTPGTGLDERLELDP